MTEAATTHEATTRSDDATDAPFAFPARAALVLAAVALLWSALPPLGLSVPALVAVAPFLIALRGLSLREALRVGFVYGLLVSVTNAWWFVNVFEPHWYAAIPLWMLLALFPAAYAAGHAALARRSPTALAVVAPALWLALDWVRCEAWHLRFAWFTLGHALSGNDLLRQDADLAGVAGLTLLCFVTGFLLERAFTYRGDGRGPICLVFAAAVCTMGLGRGNRALGFAPKLGTADPAAVTTLRVLAVQDERPGRAELKKKLTLEELARDPEPPDVILWPEYGVDEAHSGKDLAEIAARARGAFVYGTDRPASEKGRVRNLGVVLTPDGRELGSYQKRVPVQFAEGMAVPGDASPVFMIAGAKVGVMICYDSTYAFVARDLVHAGAEAILVPSMDLREWGRVQHDLHTRFYALRACELRRPIVRASSSGTSLAVDPWGRVLASVEPFEPGALTATIYPRATATLYGRGGWLLPHLAVAVCAIAGLGLGIERLRARRR